MANLDKIYERYKQKLFLLIVLFNFQVPIDSLPAENMHLFLALEYRGFPFPRPYHDLLQLFGQHSLPC